MKGEQPIVVQGHRTVHAKKEIQHQGELQDHVGGQLLGQVLIALPTVRQIVDVELWGAHEFTPLSQMTLQNGHGTVQAKAQGHGKRGKKELDIVHERSKPAALYALVGEPIADKKDDRADDEKTGHLEDPSQVPVGILDIEHGNREQGHGEHPKEHGTVQKVHHPMQFGLQGNVLGLDKVPDRLFEVLRPALVPAELLG